MGNLLSQQIGSTTTTFSYVGTTPKLSSVTSGSSQLVAYDAAGNESTIAARTYAYNPRNSLAAADNFLYLYDGRGVRTITSTTGTTPSVDSLTLNPTTLTAGNPSTATVTLTAAAGVGASPNSRDHRKPDSHAVPGR